MSDRLHEGHSQQQLRQHREATGRFSFLPAAALAAPSLCSPLLILASRNNTHTTHSIVVDYDDDGGVLLSMLAALSITLSLQPHSPSDNHDQKLILFTLSFFFILLKWKRIHTFTCTHKHTQNLHKVRESGRRERGRISLGGGFYRQVKKKKSTQQAQH